MFTYLCGDQNVNVYCACGDKIPIPTSLKTFQSHNVGLVSGLGLGAHFDG